MPRATNESNLALLGLVLLTALGACAGSAQRRNVSEDTSWYEFAWLSASPHAPTFAVKDTESALGPYAQQAKRITVGDLVRMHGHACDGLVVAAAALSVGFAELYPNGIIDRTDTGCLTNNSPCFGDVASYLTGGRIRFGTQKIEPDRGISFVLHRFTTGETIEVALRHGVFPDDLRALEAKLRSGNFTITEMRECQDRQWEFARSLLQHPLVESFETRQLEGFVWVPDAYPHRGPRGDIVNRSIGEQPADDRTGRPSRVPEP